jgi:hypothetical protein
MPIGIYIAVGFFGLGWVTGAAMIAQLLVDH